MLGSIVGDIVGSIYEFANIKTKDFEFFQPEMERTDDSICVSRLLIGSCTEGM